MKPAIVHRDIKPGNVIPVPANDDRPRAVVTVTRVDDPALAQKLLDILSIALDERARSGTR